MDEKIDEHTLLRRAAEAGALVTADQLKRWRRAGLIQRPRQEHARGRRGSRSWYPPETVAQLVAVAGLHATMHRLNDLVVAVWWAGHWVQRGARPAFRPVRGGGRDRARHEPARSLAGARADATALAGWARRLRELLWLFCVLGLGGEHEWEPDEEDADGDAPALETLLEQAAGLDRAKREGLAGNEPWLPDGVRARDAVLELRDAGAFELEDFARPVRDATDAQLDQAREDARLFSEPLATIGQVIESLVGQDVAGIGSLAALAVQDASDRAGMIRTMLVLRRAAGDEAFARIGQTVKEHYAVFTAIQQLRAALPEHAHLLRLDLSDRLADLPDSDAARVHDDLDRYLTEHPEILRALGVDEPSDLAKQ